MSAPSYTPGAIKAAAAIIKAMDEVVERCGGIIANQQKRIDQTAALIDESTAAPELLEALRQSMVVDWDHRNLERADYDGRFAAQMQWEKSVTLFGEMRREALAKAEGGES